jgi:hypothetical protein
MQDLTLSAHYEKASCVCGHPVSMHVRRGCIAYDAAGDRRCGCPSAVDRRFASPVAGPYADPAA